MPIHNTGMIAAVLYNYSNKFVSKRSAIKTGPYVICLIHRLFVIT